MPPSKVGTPLRLNKVSTGLNRQMQTKPSSHPAKDARRIHPRGDSKSISKVKPCLHPGTLPPLPTQLM